MKKRIDRQLGELLIEKSIINNAQLDKALLIQEKKGGLIGQILVALGYATEEEIAQAITMQYGFPYLPINGYKIDSGILEIIPGRIARQYSLMPIDKVGNTLTIAMSNPLNIQAIEDVETYTSCNVQVFVSTMTNVRNAIKKYYPGVN